MQAQITEGKAKEEALVQNQAKRPFVLVLVDADAEGFLVCTLPWAQVTLDLTCASSKTNT
jgi:hypothetical protein